MRLPNGHLAVVSPEKLRDYCLNPEHPRGHHKARVFAAATGITLAGIDSLTEALLQAARNGEAIAKESDHFGQRFVLDFQLVGPAGKAVIRSLWIIRSGEDFPRLASCFVR